MLNPKGAKEPVSSRLGRTEGSGAVLSSSISVSISSRVVREWALLDHPFKKNYLRHGNLQITWDIQCGWMSAISDPITALYTFTQSESKKFG